MHYHLPKEKLQMSLSQKHKPILKTRIFIMLTTLVCKIRYYQEAEFSSESIQLCVFSILDFYLRYFLY